MVYLLHFERRYPAGRRPGHYLGSTPRTVADRLADHQAGTGARLTAVVAAAGIGMRVARTWPGGRAEERRLKRRRAPARLCPECKGGTA